MQKGEKTASHYPTLFPATIYGIPFVQGSARKKQM